MVARLVTLSVPAEYAEARVHNYKGYSDHKAIAVAVNAHLTYTSKGWLTEEAAVTGVLEGCQVLYGEPCAVVAIGDRIEAAPDGPPAFRDMPRSRYAEAVAALEMAYAGFANKWGDFDDPTQVMGPLISRRQLDRVIDSRVDPAWSGSYDRRVTITSDL